MGCTSDCRAAERACAFAGHGVAAQKRDAVLLQYLAQARQETLTAFAKGVADQYSEGLRALGSEVRQVHRDQLPSDIGHVLAG